MRFVESFNFEDPCSMKYPPVVSTLEEWLDGKFGIQGIDAVSCAFYVLSLLQRDETDEPEAIYQFPFSKIVDEQALSYWPQNSWSNWGFDCYENSLAAKCVSAPAQRYEIEHLGNDLSPSLKNIKSEGGDCMTQGCVCDKQCFSLPVNDQVERCRKIFSVRDQPPNENEECYVDGCKNNLWANESACVGFLKHKFEGGGLEETNISSSMAEKVVNEKGVDSWMADPPETGNHLFLHDEKQLWDKKDDSFFSWNTTDEKSSLNVENLKEDNCPREASGIWEPKISSKQVKSITASIPHVKIGVNYGMQDLLDNPEEDHNLAQLIAKFDHSIEALWDLGGSRPGSCGISDEQENLPWSLYSAVSPPKDVLKMDHNSFENNLDSSSEENSFIPSGTNITNSIWSDQPICNDSASQFDSGMKYISGGVNNFDNWEKDDHSDLCCKLKVLLTTDEVLHNEFSLFQWNSGTSNNRIEASKNTTNNYIHEVPGECSDILWDKIQTFPSLFSHVNFNEQFSHMENFQDVESENQQNGNSCMISCSPSSISRSQGSCQDTIQDSADNGKRNFSQLNHNREDSSFTEVLPRFTGIKKYQENAIGNFCSSQIQQPLGTSSPSSNESKGNLENAVKEEEEDLLTSARTHFRPIQQEIQEPNSNPACSYADGTVFPISSSFADIPFKRSESGTLYLENDDVPDTPKKYMEYKDKRAVDQSKCVHNFSKDIVGNKGAFIPKFCVRQVEKYCQTDESDESSDELNFKSVKNDCAEKERKSNLFFSEDEIVKNVVNYVDEDDSKFSSSEIGCDDNFDDDRMDDVSAQNTKNDSVSRSLEAEMYIWNRAGCKCNNYMFSSKNDSLRAIGASFLGEKDFWEPVSAGRLCQSRYSIWSCSPGPRTEPCPTCETLTQDKTVQYSQLREELSEDGEQLLSDLSSLQPLQLSAGWLDDALDQGGWGTEPNLLTRVSSRRRLVSWGPCGEG